MNNMGLEEYKGVFIYAQQVDNELSSIAFELIGKAKELAKDLGTDVTAVLLGSNVKGLTDELGEYGADKVIVVDNPELETYRTEPYAQALAAVINEYKPEIMLVGATAIGRKQPGYLICYNAINGIGHVGIYIGNNRVIHAGSTATGIHTSVANYRSVNCVRRIVR